LDLESSEDFVAFTLGVIPPVPRFLETLTHPTIRTSTQSDALLCNRYSPPAFARYCRATTLGVRRKAMRHVP